MRSVKWADVISGGMIPGTMRRFGVDYDEVNMGRAKRSRGKHADSNGERTTMSEIMAEELTLLLRKRRAI